MKYSVCVDAFYSGKDIFAGIEEVKKCGINTIEFWTWWDKDIDKLIKVKEKTGIEISTFCTKFVSLTNANCHEEYKKGLEESIEIAHKLDCKMLISQVGQDTGEPRETQMENLYIGLKECIPLLEKNNIVLLVEPLNLLRDHAGYFLSNSVDSFALMKRLNTNNIKLLFDIYHQQITEGNVTQNMLENLNLIGHTHCAGSYGRNELDNGELCYPNIFKELVRNGYEGYFGLEYFPKEELEPTIANLLKI